MPMSLIYLAATLVVVAIAGRVINRHATIPANVRRVVNIVLALIVAGGVLWLINTYVPMAGSIKAILNIVVVVAACVGVLQAFGLWNSVVNWWSDITHRRLTQ